MAQTDAEKRAYQRGYNAGRKRRLDWSFKLLAVARRIRDRLTDTNPDRSCQTCDRWTRGGATYQWGMCRADFEWDVEPRMWIDSRAPDLAEITTSEDFGCVSWLPRNRSKG